MIHKKRLDQEMSEIKCIISRKDFRKSIGQVLVGRHCINLSKNHNRSLSGMR